MCSIILLWMIHIYVSVNMPYSVSSVLAWSGLLQLIRVASMWNKRIATNLCLSYNNYLHIGIRKLQLNLVWPNAMYDHLTKCNVWPFDQMQCMTIWPNAMYDHLTKCNVWPFDQMQCTCMTILMMIYKIYPNTNILTSQYWIHQWKQICLPHEQHRKYI